MRRCATGERSPPAERRHRQILSGRTIEPRAYVQPPDEWVVLLAGRAALDVDGDQVVLRANEWLSLPSGVAHAVVETEPGASCLAVHLHPH